LRVHYSSDFITFLVCILHKFAYSQIKQDGLAPDKKLNHLTFQSTEQLKNNVYTRIEGGGGGGAKGGGGRVAAAAAPLGYMSAAAAVAECVRGNCCCCFCCCCVRERKLVLL
jgi:hypothetical protein